MKNTLALLMLALCINAAAQIQGASGHSIFAVEVGYTNFRPYAVNDHLFPGNSGFENLITYGGSFFGISGGRYAHTWDAAIGFHLFQPQERMGTLDSLSYQVRGWELMTSIFGYDVLNRVNAVDLTFAPGMYWGNLKLRKYFDGGNPGQFELFKNPYIAPMVRADLRFVLGPVAVGGRASFRYDITSARWKKGNSVQLPGYRFRELQYMVYIGIVFSDEK